MKSLLALLWLINSAGAQAAPVSGTLALRLRAHPQVATVPVTLDGQVQLTAEALRAAVVPYHGQRWGSLQFHGLRLAASCLHLDTTVQAWPFQDRLTWQVCSTPAGNLRLQIADAWLPQALLRNRLQAAVQRFLKASHVTLPMVLTADTWQIDTQALAITTPSGTLRFPLSPPRWQITPEAVVLSARAPAPARGTAPLSLAVQASGQGTWPDVQGAWRFQLQAQLDAPWLKKLRSADKALGDWVTAATVDARAAGQWQTGPQPQLQGSAEIRFPHVQEPSQAWAAASYPLDLRLQASPQGWQFALTPRYPARPVTPPPVFSANAAVPIIDGVNYFPVMLRAVAAARHSIELESYMFYPGKTTRQLADALTLKAAGLRRAGSQLEADPAAPEGIPVQILHHHGMSPTGAQQVAALFAEVQRELLATLAGEATPIAQRLRAHLTVHSMPPGIARIDHRKLLIIDGRLGFTGGLNLGDHYLTADAFHDLMVQVEGPVVAQLQQYFQRNWMALGGVPLGKQWPEIKPPSGPVAAMAAVATDATDWSALDAILTVIHQAQRQIRLQHAYLHFAPVQAALKAALERGVRIELMVPETSDESPFDVLNAVAARELIAAAPQAGRVTVWLYQGHPGQHTYMAHSKYLSADGQQAVVGSTNLVARSLWSPFYVPGRPQQILFNQEIGLWIRDAALVQQLDQALLVRDQAVSRRVDDFALMQLLRQRGGASRVIFEQLKAFLS